MTLCYYVDWTVVQADLADLITRAKGLDAIYDAYVADAHKQSYDHAGVLAAVTTYIPAANTVIQASSLSATAELSYRYGAVSLFPDFWSSLFGLFGSFWCDGTNHGIRNSDAVQHDLTLSGWTMT